MTTPAASLLARSENKCELCQATRDLMTYQVGPQANNLDENNIITCPTCNTQINDKSSTDPNHWRCLNTTMWSQIPAVQVVAWRILDRLKSQGWAQDLLDMLYLEDEIQTWAQAGADLANPDDSDQPTKDANGTPLAEGDSVHLIKDLAVKGAGFTAKRGTAVRNIHLTENPEQIEGRVNGTQIVLLTCYLKKI